MDLFLETSLGHSHFVDLWLCVCVCVGGPSLKVDESEGREGKLWRARDVSGTEISFKRCPAELYFPSPWLTTVLKSRGL